MGAIKSFLIEHGKEKVSKILGSKPTAAFEPTPMDKIGLSKSKVNRTTESKFTEIDDPWWNKYKKLARYK